MDSQSERFESISAAGSVGDGNGAGEPPDGPEPARLTESGPPPDVASDGPEPTRPQWAPPPPFEASSSLPGEAGLAASGPSPAEREFRSAGWLARATALLLGFSGLVALGTTIHYIVGLEIQGRLNQSIAEQAEADAFNSLSTSLVIAGLLLQIVCALFVLRWLWRSVKNSTLLGAGAGIQSPRGAVLVWFVPVLNIFRPYQVVRDLHDRLLAPLESRPGRWLVRTWWLFWLLGSIVGDVVFATSQDAATGSSRLVILALLGLSAAVTVADSLLAIGVVMQIQRLSNAREAARRGSPDRAIELVADSQRRRITFVPFGLAVVALVLLAAPLTVMGTNASASSPWNVYRPADGRFSVSMPGKTLEKDMPATFESVAGHEVRSGSGGDLALVVAYYDYPAGMLASIGPTNAFDSMVAALPASLTIQGARDTSVDGRPARELTGLESSSGTHLKIRLCLDGDRVYSLEADTIGAAIDSSDVRTFLDSFRLK